MNESYFTFYVLWSVLYCVIVNVFMLATRWRQRLLVLYYICFCVAGINSQRPPILDKKNQKGKKSLNIWGLNQRYIETIGGGRATGYARSFQTPPIRCALARRGDSRFTRWGVEWSGAEFTHTFWFVFANRGNIHACPLYIFTKGLSVLRRHRCLSVPCVRHGICFSWEGSSCQVRVTETSMTHTRVLFLF